MAEPEESNFPPTAKRLKTNEPKPKVKPKGASERGYDARHQAIRLSVLAAHPVCQWCEQKFSHHLHHANHNPHDISPENLVALCADCHLSYHLRIKHGKQ